MEDLKLPERLAALADEVRPQTFVPAGLTRRARRRAALVLGAIVVCLVLASVGLSAGVRAFLRAEGTRPADPPAPAPGTIVTVVGSGEPGTAGVGGPAAEAQLGVPIDIAFDPAGTMYFAERYFAERFGDRILKVDTAGVLTVAAGAATGSSEDGILATEADLTGASTVAVDPVGNLYIADVTRIRMVDSSGVITTVAGTGRLGYSGDGGAATDADIDSPLGMAFDGRGNLYFQDSGNYVVRKVDRNGIITTVAGTGRLGPPAPDGTPATAAPLGSSLGRHPLGLAFDPAGRLHITDFGLARIWMIDERGRIHTVAGNGRHVITGDGAPASEAGIGNPLDIAFGPDGALFITAYVGGLQGGSVRMVDPDGIITTVAGTGVGGYSGDGGPARLAEFNVPSGIAVGPDGNLYIADALNSVIRMVVL